MKSIRILSRAFCLFALAASSFSAALAQSSLPSIELKAAWPNLKFNRPLWMCEVPDGSHRQFVVEQEGRVWILPADRNGSEPKLFLDIFDRHPFRDNEEGLLAMAFHPQYKTNGKFYIFYSHPTTPKHTVLAEMQVSKNDPDKADPSTERILLKVRKEPQNWNHNGGTLLFGPDGDLYLGIGDGGSGFDPLDAGQNLEVLYGKIIRIDVNSKTAGLEYGIPTDNPFVDVSKQGDLKADPLDKEAHVTRQEIWAYGVRNPWRMSFDRETGELWVADVGQDKFEEVDVIKKGGNYGWSAREGFHPLVKEHKVRGSEPIDPVIEYGHNADLAQQSRFPNHSTGISITGGYVYRGKKIPALRGVYIYADFQMGTIWGLRYENGKLTADGTLVKEKPSRNISSFAEDSDGELYVVSFDGKIYQIVATK
ncbi:MAG TPA: PQQ-dependent sugar dehydrogenase [Verrucomicrobiae bacterium]|nr:PQQ-dependent sugar dehydrogenase [Verrucomicrobiae bacterium]